VTVAPDGATFAYVSHDSLLSAAALVPRTRHLHLPVVRAE
jgi:hypothetical protein